MSTQRGARASALADLTAQLVLTHESSASSSARAAFAARPLNGIEPFVDELEIAVAVDPEGVLPEGFETVATSKDYTFDVLAQGELGSVLVRVAPESTIIIISSESPERLNELRVAVRTQAVAAERAAGLDPDEIELVVWWHTHRGSARRTRRVNAPCWDPGTARNYPKRVRAELERLMVAGPPSGTGRLVLWHGEPGTGKTTAVLALLRAWRTWCEGFLITDPERMFLETHYLQEVLTTEPAQNRLLADRVKAPRWRLLVAEDADEYLRADAKQRSGPALGRLLNASDGILGRGSRTIILLTTNDDLGRLHPAVTRPGRAMAIIEFTRFGEDEANGWLDGAAASPPQGATLAELFELRDHAAGPGVQPEAVLATGAYL